MIRLIVKIIKCFRENGFSYTWHKILQSIRKKNIEKNMSYIIQYSPEELEEQGHYENPSVHFSVITPLYNTPLPFLKEMIQSVQNQTFGNWELCLADGSDDEHRQVMELCNELAQADPRIRYKKLRRNGGISENTNECIRMATGNYIVLLDHDDVLHQCALYEVAKVIEEQHADFIYSDEAKFKKNTSKFFAPNFKPDFSKDELRAHNYICHLTVYRKELLDQVGLYRPECDGSQDHDMVLRLTECADKIVHIPKILYFWRVHGGSVSAGVETKSYAVEAAYRAVKDQLERCGEQGEVSSIKPYQTLYRVDYSILGHPRVSVILYNLTDIDDCQRCVKAMEDMCTYYPVELLVLEGKIESGKFAKFMKQIPTVKPVSLISKEEQSAAENVLNLAAERATGEYLVFLNSEAVIQSKKWTEELLMYAQRPDVGIVGGKCRSGNGAIYSAGIAISGTEKSLIHPMHRGENPISHGYAAALYHPRNTTAVEGSCMMISREKFFTVQGLRSDMGTYQFMDLCLKLREKGFLNVYTPFVEFVYWGREDYTAQDKAYFVNRWEHVVSRQDPYYNINVENSMIF